ncbi:MAG: hypothetical protein MUF34_11940 [Polyangiaceae bacterium]|nr:hypothetical protein [Polyangiaceae bacterium]
MFVDRLRTELTIEADGASVAVPSRHVERFDARLFPWGFEVELTFWIICESDPSEDELFEAFLGPGQVKASLELGRTFDEVGEEAEALSLVGLAVERSVVEQPVDEVSGAPVLARRYALRFVDRARALWSQHRPTSLYVDASYADLFADNLPEGLALEHAWAASSTQRPVLSLGLGAAWGRAPVGPSLPRPTAPFGRDIGGPAPSFLDFTFWLLDRECAGLFYDIAGDAYQIADAKPAATSPVSLEPDEIEAIELRPPSLRREQVVVLNASTEAAEAKHPLANADALEGLRADTLTRTPIASEFDARVKLETARARQRETGALVTLRRTPAAALAPNLALKLGQGFSDKLFASGKTYRIVTLRLRGVPPRQAEGEMRQGEGEMRQGEGEMRQGEGAQASQGEGAQASQGAQTSAAEIDRIEGRGGGVEASLGRRYELDYELGLELASDPVFHAPPFAEPAWPFQVEGIVVSDAGADDEQTYQAYRDEATSLDYYKIAVPLFEGKKVIAPYEPASLTGQFYFPLYKGERVLVALDFDRARVAGHLDWRPGARLPLDSQGNHLLFGKKGASQTSLRHTYADGKPSLTIERTSGTDLQTVVISEGTIRLETTEKS